MSAYRMPSVPPHEDPPLPAELAYRPTVRGPERSIVAGILDVMVPVFTGCLAAATVTPVSGLTVGLVSYGVLLWRRRRHDSSSVVLRVEGGVLEVKGGRRQTVRARVWLGDLADVVLDTRLQHVIHEGPGPVPAVAFAESRVGATIDRARIVLVRAPPLRAIPLTAERGSSSEATEELGRIRVFLRRHGWVPADERGTATEELEEEEDDDEDDVR
jgi:hypothetical protein